MTFNLSYRDSWGIVEPRAGTGEWFLFVLHEWWFYLTLWNHYGNSGKALKQ